MKSSNFIWIILIFIILLLILATRHKKTYDFLFKNPFGAIILICIVGLGLYVNTHLGIYIGFIVGLFFLLAKIFQEAFTQMEPGTVAANAGYGKKNKWSKKTTNAFIALNQTLYGGMFDIDILQDQASEKEALEFLETQLWPWTEDTKRGYSDILKTNTMLRTDTYWMTEEARGTYTNNAMKQLIEWNSPEGKLLLYGRNIPNTHNIYTGSGTYGLNSGLVSLGQDVVRCGTNGKMVRYHNMDNDGITGAHRQKVTEVDYKDLPKLLPGFTWEGGEPCNPCENLENPPEIKCRFKIPPPRKTLVVETNQEATPWTVSWL